DPEDAVEDTPVIHAGHATRLVRKHRLDGGPLVVGKFVAHDSHPWFGGLNHANTSTRNLPPLPLFPHNRTCPRQGKIDPNDPERTSTHPVRAMLEVDVTAYLQHANSSLSRHLRAADAVPV